MRSYEKGSHDTNKVHMEKILKQFKLKKNKGRKVTKFSLVYHKTS